MPEHACMNHCAWEPMSIPIPEGFGANMLMLTIVKFLCQSVTLFLSMGASGMAEEETEAFWYWLCWAQACRLQA